MSPKRDSTLADPQQIIDDLQRRLADAEQRAAERTAERNERTQERDEALAREAATAEVLGVINASPGDLAPVFDAMLDKAMHLCEAAYGQLVIYDGECFDPVAVKGEPRIVDWLRQRGPVRPGSGTTIERITRGERVVHITDAMDDDAYRQGDDTRRAMVEIGGCRTALTVALHKDDALLGAITVYRQVVRAFTEQQIALLQSFAAQAVIAMENARLITETREALEQQTATAEVLQVINSSPGDLTPVFDAMLERATRLCEADFGTLWTFDGDRFRPVVGRGHGAAGPNTMPEGLRPAPGMPLGQLIAGKDVATVVDAATDPAFQSDPATRSRITALGTRSAVAVALRKDDALFGAITANRSRVEPYSHKQIALLQNFAAQAVIAMENARLLTETREALAQQTATSEVLGVINASPGDLTPVFEALLEKALRLCDGAFGVFQTYDGEFFHAAAVRGMPPALAEFMRQPFRVGRGATTRRLADGEQIIHIADMAAEEPTPGLRAMVEMGDGRTVVFVALRREETLLGFIAIYRQEVRPFTDKQIALLQNFAAQAVIAMENARLITETREALEQQTATAEVLGVINSSPGNLVPVFDVILEKAHSLCGIAQGALSLYDGEYFRAVAIRGYPDALAEVVRQPYRGNAAHQKLLEGERCAHIADVAEFAAKVDDAVGMAFRNTGIGSMLMMPMRKDGRLLGHIGAARREIRLFTEKEIALLENFAAQAVIAMENARLLGELRQRTEEVAELNRGLESRVAEQVDELGRVGRLKRFLAPQLAELIVSQGDEKILESHRREIVVVFCDLRGYTAFTETAEPEEVLDFLREYHGALGPLVAQFEGTLDQFSGDGIMVFFNDPVPIPDPAERAVKMAMAMREVAAKLIAAWRQRGRELGFGAGIAQGYATLGQIGFADRSGYTAIGTVCNVAARLCAEAKDGQILIGQRVNAALAANIATEQIGALTLKGLTQPVIAFNVPVSADGASAAASGRRRRAPNVRPRRPRIAGTPA